MVARGRKTAKSVKAPQRAKSTRKPQSTRPKSRKTKSGERRADKPKSETARLKSLLRDAEDRQTATADILKVIASSPDDVQPVFEAIAERSNRLVNGLSSAVYSLVDGTVHLMAFTSVSPVADAALQASFPAQLSQFSMAAVGKGETYTIVDAEVEFATRPSGRELARLRGWRSLLGVPLLREEKPIGLITVTRAEPGRFDDHHIQLLQTFADQAVIAIGN